MQNYPSSFPGMCQQFLKIIPLENPVTKKVNGEEMLKTRREIEEHLKSTVYIYGGLISLKRVLDDLIMAQTDTEKLKAVRDALRWRDQYL